MLPFYQCDKAPLPPPCHTLTPAQRAEHDLWVKVRRVFPKRAPEAGHVRLHDAPPPLPDGMALLQVPTLRRATLVVTASSP